MHRGRGTIGIDLDAYKTVVTGFPGQGKLFVAFSHHGFGPSAADAGVTEQSKTLIYALRNFSADTSQWQPVDALFYGHKNGLTGVTSVRVAAYADIPEIPNDTPAKELLVGRARYNIGVGGRAEVAIVGGDLGSEVSSAVSAGTATRVWSSRRPRSAVSARSLVPGTAPGRRPAIREPASSSWRTVSATTAIRRTSTTAAPIPDAPATDIPGVPTVMPSGNE